MQFLTFCKGARDWCEPSPFFRCPVISSVLIATGIQLTRTPDFDRRTPVAIETPPNDMSHSVDQLHRIMSLMLLLCWCKKIGISLPCQHLLIEIRLLGQWTPFYIAAKCASLLKCIIWKKKANRFHFPIFFLTSTADFSTVLCMKLCQLVFQKVSIYPFSKAFMNITGCDINFHDSIQLVLSVISIKFSQNFH